MSDWLQRKYVMLCSSRLDRFKVKKQSPFLANFRCCFCGDSATDKRKTRGYIYERKGSFFYSCHNCGLSTTAMKMVKKLDPTLYNDYMMERLDETYSSAVRSHPAEEFKAPAPVFPTDPFRLATQLDHLTNDHTAWQFINRRKIDKGIAEDWYHTETFYALVNDNVPGKFNSALLKLHDHPRLIIPFYLNDNPRSLIAFQGRDYSPNALIRYITTVVDDTHPHIYGLPSADPSKPVYVFEGPIDSTFVPNSIATAGSDMLGSLARLRASVAKFRDAEFIICLDNEPRNKEIVKQMRKCIKAGYKVCIWPSWVQDKDVNDLVLAGGDPSLAVSRVFQGIIAELEMTHWAR